MNWLFLRGKMERHKECMWGSLEECTDMWTHLFAGLVEDGDAGSILYSNGDRLVYYRPNFTEKWIKSFKDYKASEPDIIVARGGFKEYLPLLKRYPNAKKVYYGANHGCVPKDGIKYDLIMCDSEKQVRKCRKRGLNGKLFIKPASPQFYKWYISKTYDVGFSAIWPKDKRKNVSWVHKTAPHDIKILQMGHGVKSPSNFSVKNIRHENMCIAINRCKVIIAPYTGVDSCPRIISEAIACGVPVVALDSCQFWREKYPVDVVSKKNFWHIVRERIKAVPTPLLTDIYAKDLSIPVAAKHLRKLVLYGSDSLSG